MPSTQSYPRRGTDLCWNQYVRLLFTLNISDLLELKECMTKILNNILAHPDEEKYSRIKYNNAVIQNKVLKHAGGEEILLATGFQKEVQPATAELYLTLPITALIAVHKEKELMDKLQATLNWLESTIQTCLSFHELKINTGSRSAMDGITAQILIQIELPTTKRVTGGFFVHDTFQDIYDFACSYFAEDRRPYIILRIPRSDQIFSEDIFDKTLEELRLFPQAKFIASALTPQQNAEQRLTEAHVDAVKEIEYDKKKVFDEKAKKREQRKAEEDAREKVLQQFQEDREARKRKANAPMKEENK